MQGLRRQPLSASLPRILLWERQEDAHGPEGHRSYLEVVGSRHIPKALDRAALASELAQCTTWHEVAYGVTDLAQAKRDIKHLEAINKVARRLDLLFVSNDLVRHELAGELPGGMAALEGVVRGLIEITDRSLAPYREPVTAANCEAELEKCLIREAEIEKHLIAAIDDMHGPQTNTPSVLDEVRSREGSALEWLVGKRLSDIFERHFGARATLARSAGGEIDSPYIRFATQTMVELGIPCQPETIAKAVTAARTGRARSR